MPLPQIADFLQNRDVARIEEKLRQQKQEVGRRKQALERIERKIDNRLHQLSDAQALPLGQIEQLESEPCRLFWIGQTLRITDCSELEMPTIQLAQRQAEALVFLGKVGVSVSEAHLRAGSFSQYDGMFLVLEKEDAFEGDVTSWGGACACASASGAAICSRRSSMRGCLLTQRRTALWRAFPERSRWSTTV